MKLQAIVILTGLAASPVLAQSLPPVVLTPIVPTAKLRQVGFFTSVNPDCSSTGDIDARLIKKPEHGDVELEPGSGFAFWKPDNQRYQCNTKPLQGIRIKYTSKDGYAGRDAFDVEFLSNVGSDVVWKFSVTVK